jgi:large subunit ribosomal protein L4
MKAAGGKAASSIDVAEGAFDAKYNESLVHQLVTAYQAGARQGTRAQKNRSAVSGGGAKPWRQKGTGHARAGTSRSPIWRGGGKVFPAQTRNFEQKLNRKMYRAGIRSILSELLRQERLLVVEDLAMDAPKTKALVEQLNTLGAQDNALLVTETFDMNLALSARNLPYVDVCDVASASPVNLVRHNKVVMTVAAIKKFEEWLA